MDKINQEDMKRICLWNSLTRTASIPCLLSIARLMADVTGRAAEGAVSAVFQTALFLVGLFLAFSLLQAGSDIMVRRQQAKAMNRCRCAFLETVLRNPLHRICRADYGELNEKARQICAEHGIPVNDLYRLCVEENLQKSDGVHFQEEGYRRLAHRVAEALRREL